MVYTIIVCVAVFHHASVQCKATCASQQYRYKLIGFLVNMSSQCYLPELGPALGAGRGKAARCSYSCYSYVLTDTGTGIQLYASAAMYKVQLQLYSYIAAAARAAGCAAGCVLIISRNSIIINNA